MSSYVLQPIGAGPAVTAFDPQIRYVGSSIPVPGSTWTTSDLWIDTLDEGTTGIVIRRWTGSVFIPARP
jgi:hypothetical protein